MAKFFKVNITKHLFLMLIKKNITFWRAKYMPIELSTVNSTDQVLNNINEFNSDLENNRMFCKKLSQFKHWYYSPELDLFGPSKYIGYKEMSASKYKVCLQYMDFDGRETEATLKKYIKPSCDNEIEQLTTKLLNLFSSYCKKPNKRFKIHVLKDK